MSIGGIVGWVLLVSVGATLKAGLGLLVLVGGIEIDKPAFDES